MTTANAEFPPSAANPRRPGTVGRPWIGARVGPDGVRYRVWALEWPSLALRILRRGGAEERLAMVASEDGYFEAADPAGRGGDRYVYEFPDGSSSPDVASRFQPEGVHGPSECIDASRYPWRVASWRRPAWRGQVVYELHVGTFTQAGTFLGATQRLDHVRELGATAIEIMPIADFPGSRNWGYDGVALYAPSRAYGRPDELRALVDAAHERGLAVILDVVYNHMGPDGNYLGRFSKDYFHARHSTPWGAGFNLNGPNSGPVRDFLVGNALYWLDEFRIDGLRLDATHAILDSAEPSILGEIAALAHIRGAFVIAEDERNSVDLLTPAAAGGSGLDAAWSDDFHHEVRVALTGTRESYYAHYRGTAADVARTLASGWSYLGQPFAPWKGRPRGAPCRHLPVESFVYCIENHDQVGNRAQGERLEHLVEPAAFRAAVALLCLSPYTPMLFMGQEWAARSPFLYFTDHSGELGRQVSEGRRKEFNHPNPGEGGGGPPDPQAPDTFLRSKLRWEEADSAGHAAVVALHRECLAQRRLWLRSADSRDLWSVRAAGEVIVLRYRVPDGPDRLLLVALRRGAQLRWAGHADLAAPAGCAWKLVLHTEGARFGGGGGSDEYPDPTSLLDFARPAAALYISDPG